MSRARRGNEMTPYLIFSLRLRPITQNSDMEIMTNVFQPLPARWPLALESERSCGVK